MVSPEAPDESVIESTDDDAPGSPSWRGCLQRVPLSLVVGLGVLLLINAWWLERFRAGYPLSIDEAGYLTMGLVDAAGLRTGGLTGLWNAVQSSKLQAPLGPLATVPFHLLFGTSTADGFALSLVLFVVLGILTYVLARTVMSRGWSVLAALTVCAAPMVTLNARDFLLALPLAVTFTAAIWAVARSGGMAKTGWALAAGVLLGAATLSRTMGLGFVAGPVVAAAVQAGVLRPIVRRMVGLAVLVVSGVAVAITWYARSFPTVWQYLNGKGPYFSPGGPKGHGATRALWLVALHGLALQALYLPLTVGLAICLAAGIVAVIDRWLHRPSAGRRVPGPSTMQRIRGAVRAPWFVPVVCLLEAGAVLAVSHQSEDQWLPVIPVLTVCAVGGLSKLRWPGVRRVVAGYLVVVMVVNTVMMSDTVSWLTVERSVNVPVIGSVPVFDGQGDLRAYLYGSDQPVGAWTSPAPPPAKEWLPFNSQVAAWIADFGNAHHFTPVVTFASRDKLFNTNTLQLESQATLRHLIPSLQLLATLNGVTEDSYRAQLTDPAYGEPNLLITVAPDAAEYKPQLDQQVVARAAASVGFVPVHSLTLPDGRHGEIWWRPS